MHINKKREPQFPEKGFSYGRLNATLHKKHWLTGKSFKAKGLYLPIYIQTPLTLPFLPRRGTGKAALAKCPSALPIYLQKIFKV
jgi:hypothetical protein